LVKFDSPVDPSSIDSLRMVSMTASLEEPGTLHAFDDATRALVRLAAVVAAGTEQSIRKEMASAHGHVPALWVEELLLQSYLFAGFPRALNAMREWRRYEPMSAAVQESLDVDDRRADGVATCSAVYGSMYERLRQNIRTLHPLLDDWMITEGYGKVLSRPALDLGRRELCIVAACAASGQDRQLHSHLHGAVNVGVATNVIEDSLEALSDILGADRAREVGLLWARVKGK
jgi:4-carboxymuconolactone decarboxylase